MKRMVNYRAISIALAISAFLLLAGCTDDKNKTITTLQAMGTTMPIATTLPGGSQIPNPASVYCAEQGYTNEIRADADGSQYGVCVFPDGTECEEWKLFRKECNQTTALKATTTLTTLEGASGECNNDLDCKPSTCCHPAECMPNVNKLNCNGFACTMDCRPGTLDCGQGSCRCIDNKCRAVING